MKIELFHRGHYKIYQSWSENNEFNLRLGPVDDEWLEFVLNDKSGIQYAFLHQDQLVAVIGIVIPTTEHDYFTLTDISVSPNLKSKGLGSKALALILDLHKNEQNTWKAFVENDNISAKSFFIKNGWISDFEIDESNMITFTYSPDKIFKLSDLKSS